MYVVLFSNNTSGSAGDHYLNNKFMRYTGQMKQRANDKYFNDSEIIFIIVTKTSANPRWHFFGTGNVVTQVTERVRHATNPTPPQWILKYERDDEGAFIDVAHMNNCLLAKFCDSESYIRKEHIFDILHAQKQIAPCYMNFRSVGIVPMMNTNAREWTG